MKRPLRRDQREAALSLLEALDPKGRRITLRTMWRFMPFKQRTSPLLKQARPFASNDPRAFPWQQPATLKRKARKLAAVAGGAR